MTMLLGLLAGIALSGSTPATSASPPATPAPGTYQAMIDRLKAGATDVDFAALRQAATAQPDFSGYDQLDETATMKAAAAGDWKQVETICDQQLSHRYLDINAHVMDAAAADKLGQADEAALHQRIARGLVAAMLASGDGKSAKTAFHVIGVDEEYLFLRLTHLKPGKQSLVNQGGLFDVLDATDAAGTTHSIWFDISSFFGKGWR